MLKLMLRATLCFLLALQLCAGLATPGLSFLPGGIPRLIHQVFLSGRDALAAEEVAPNSKFRRDWRQSCQVHNPGWQYILWDQAMAETLLRDKYPWFLDVFKSLPLVVLRGDAIRPFILHAYGGVYLDMDTECMGPFEESLLGHSLVLQAESTTSVNNAQMASVQGHPFWISMQQHANTSCRELISVPGKLFDSKGRAFYSAILEATGPLAESRLLRAYLGLGQGMTLPGRYPDAGWAASVAHNCSLPGGACSKDGQPRPATVQVYAPLQWFQACEWKQLKCPLDLARCKPAILALNAARSSIKNATAGSQSHVRQQLVPTLVTPSLLLASAPFHIQLLLIATTCQNPVAQSAFKSKPWSLQKCACQFGGLVGAHHFSGTWMRDRRDDENKKRVAAAKGLVVWMGLPDAWVQLIPASTGAAQPLSGQSERAALSADTHAPSNIRLSNSASAVHPGLTDSLKPISDSLVRKLDAALWPVLAKGRGSSCHILSITQFQHPVTGFSCCQRLDTEFMAQCLVDLASWSGSHSCTLTVMTDLPRSHPHLRNLPQASHVRYIQQQLSLPMLPASNASMGVSQAAPTPSHSIGGTAVIAGERDRKGLAGTLEAMLLQWQHTWPGASGLDVLHVSGPADMPLQAVRDLPDTKALPLVVLLDIPVVHMSTRSTLVPAYQHLYQELGYQGHYHSDIALANVTDTLEATTCADCFVPRNCTGNRCIMPAVRLGMMLRRAVLDSEQRAQGIQVS